MDDANTAQREHWNSVIGPKWVALGPAMDARMAEIAALLVACAAGRSDELVLDVGCGTGAISAAMLEAVGPGGSVTGLDISAPMLQAARLAVPGVQWVLADAQTWSPGAARFDLVVSRFGVMFFEDPVAAFANLRAAMRPAGRLCFVCWATLEQNPHWAIPHGIVARHLGPAEPSVPHAPGPMAFSDRDYLHSVLVGAGFLDIGIEPVGVRMLGASAEAEATLACLIGPSGAWIGEAKPSPEQVAVIQAEMTEAFAAFVGPEGARLPATVYLVTARPG